jgi:hypothetical protein
MTATPPQKLTNRYSGEDELEAEESGLFAKIPPRSLGLSFLK